MDTEPGNLYTLHTLCTLLWRPLYTRWWGGAKISESKLCKT